MQNEEMRMRSPVVRASSGTLHSSLLTLHLKWWVATVLPRALRFKRPLHRCNACNPIATRRPAKCKIQESEGRIGGLGRSAFFILTSTFHRPGFRIALKWSERRVTLPLTLAPEASASLLGYALLFGKAVCSFCIPRFSLCI